MGRPGDVEVWELRMERVTQSLGQSQPSGCPGSMCQSEGQRPSTLQMPEGSAWGLSWQKEMLGTWERPVQRDEENRSVVVKARAGLHFSF